MRSTGGFLRRWTSGAIALVHSNGNVVDVCCDKDQVEVGMERVGEILKDSGDGDEQGT